MAFYSLIFRNNGSLFLTNKYNMALIDIVKCEINEKELVYKSNSDDLRLGTQLVVYPGQTAFFMKGGQILDRFNSGTYTLKTENIPLLNKIINLPFGSRSPFKAEVWFINTLAVLDSKWGTATPIQIEDPKYDVIVPVRAYGQYGLKVKYPRLFLESLVGNMSSFSVEKVRTYFKGKVMSQLNNLISDKLTQDKISILTINSHLNTISAHIQQSIGQEFEKYGLEIENFYVISISVPEDDASFAKLKEAKDLAARMKIAGRDLYQMDRSFGVLDTAAANESGSGNLINAGLGIGAGLAVGTQVGTMATNTFSPPPLPQNVQYFIALNGQQLGPYDTNTISTYIVNKQITAETLIWKHGMPNWEKTFSLPEFKHLFTVTPPPLPPTMR